ncbi:MAG: hypothetical protein GVY11_08345 [Gammaproteobacteria bacterium]|nr:hypothetical protein [Gammaproteobacteria bacterium]
MRGHAIELLGDEFAGSWYDAELNKLVIAVVDKRKYSIIEAIGGVPEFREYSLSELSSGEKRLNVFAKFHDAAKVGIVSWHVDVVENALIIEHLPNARPAAIRLLESAGVAGNVPIRLNVVDGFATLTYAVRGGDQTDNATQYRPCSVGLPIAGGFIIAGH